MAEQSRHWRHHLITGIAGFTIFEIIVLLMQLAGWLGFVASGVLNAILVPVQIGSIVILGLNLILTLFAMPFFQKKVRLPERTKPLIAVLIPIIQLLIIISMLLLSMESFCRMLSFSLDMHEPVLQYSRQALIVLLPTTIIASAISYVLRKTSVVASLLTVVGIGFAGFIFFNLATGELGMPHLGDAMIVAVQPFAFLLPALRIDLLVPEKKRTEGKHMNAEVSKGVTGKNRIIAALLAFFIGSAGVHRYYLGYSKAGAIQTCGLVGLVIGFSLCSAALYAGGILAIFALLFLMFGLVTEVWSFVDFIRILTGSLIPADGTPYTENSPKQVHVVNPTPSVSGNADALEKLAALHKQGVLTDEEFQKKKADILERI